MGVGEAEVHVDSSLTMERDNGSINGTGNGSGSLLGGFWLPEVGKELGKLKSLS